MIWNYKKYTPRFFTKTIVFVCFFLTIPHTINSQFVSANHFDENSGYKGLRTYTIAEDSKKNIWLSTEQGIYKFNGYSFKEIISSNEIGHEVFDLFCDSDDNIWLGSFSPLLSYISPDGEYTIADSNQNGALRFFESTDKTTLFYFNDERKLHYYIKNKKSGILYQDNFYDSTKLIENIKKLKIDLGYEHLLLRKIKNHLIKNTKYGSINIDNIYFHTNFSTEILSTINSSEYKEIRNSNKFMVFLGKEIKVFNEDQQRENTLEKIIEQLKIKPYEFGTLFIDSEKNVWITTLNRGIYHFKNDYKENYTIGNVLKESFTLKKINSSILLSQENVLKSLNIKEQTLDTFYISKKNIKDFIQAQDLLFFLSDGGFLSYPINIKTKKQHKIYFDEKIYNWHIKKIIPIDNNTFCFIEQDHVKFITLVNDSLLVTKILDISRVNNMLETSDFYYFTSINNLYRINKKSNKINTIPGFKKINSTCLYKKEKEIILIGTYGNGLWELNTNNLEVKKVNSINVKIIKDIKESPSNNSIYINSDEGILVVDKNSLKLIKTINNKSYLPSNNINDFFITDSSVMCLTNYGVTINSNDPKSEINEWSLNFTNTKKRTSKEKVFNYKDNNMSFIVDHKSLKYLNTVIINYRLNGFIEQWTKTTNPTIIFNKLNPGNYSLEVFISSPDESFNSKHKTLTFKIKSPYWKTNVFYFTIIVLFLFIIYSFYRFRLNASLRKEKVEKLNYQLSLQSIQSQINPHFFSNVLTGIQNLILKKDIDTANEYIYNLGSLSRDIIASSKEDLWSLTNEVKLLENYLDFEKIRFKERFDYSINIDKHINKEATLVPSMIIQPLAENAIKHAFKAEEIGLLTISFSLTENNINIEISDNGTGFKSKEGSTGYGLKIVKEKLNLIKNIYKKEVSFKITKNNFGGTSCTITLPKNIKK